jgi:D-alanyl-D-alanine carboxypeptidase/D-alanyl-D-alanine-endopeptidase (penicillin-binding protein 4)
MNKLLLVTGYLLLVAGSYGQTVSQKLQKAFLQFEGDSQLKHAISSLYVIDAKTGQVVFDKNAQVGLAPASTQKIITAAAAYELLGRNFAYKTFFYLGGPVMNDTLKGDFIIKGVGDPTIGSFRYSVTRNDIIFEALIKMLRQKNIKHIAGRIIIDESGFETNSIPDGWIWQDIGNYYGAGAGGFNWNENQYELILKSGLKKGDKVEIAKAKPENAFYSIINELKTGAKGSGDNAYLYFPPYSFAGFVRGTIPPGENDFSISGSIPYPSLTFLSILQNKVEQASIKIKDKFTTTLELKGNQESFSYNFAPFNFLISPSLDSIIYWFLKKSINLYGEALIKTFAYEKQGFGSTDSGVVIVKKFWKDKGLDENELNIYDGSGLSPLNRVTTHAQVEILKYAKTKDWFQYFYNSLPDYNGMKMKSGTISDVKGFCGYHNAKDGKEYIFSFLVNNYSGKTSGVVEKMYQVLDVLK